MINHDMARERCGDDGILRRGCELLIVDPGVADASVLLDGRRTDIEVLQLAPDGRGLEQIAAHLSGRRGVTALHILSHGMPGALLLAGGRIDVPALAMRPGVLADIAGALAADAQVVLYGCSLAAGPAGHRFVDFLEASLGVAVAASVTPVGAEALGGSWKLRGRYGRAVAPAFAEAACAAYAGLLVSQTDTAGNDTLTGTAGNDDISGLAGNDIIYG